MTKQKAKESVMYKDLTPEQVERIFAEDVLGWNIHELLTKQSGRDTYMRSGLMKGKYCSPLTNLDHAMMGVEKLKRESPFDNFAKFCEQLAIMCDANQDDYYADVYNLMSCISESPEAIVEACIRIVRPDLFDNERGL